MSSVSTPAATAAGPAARLASTLDCFFTRCAPLAPGDRVLVAFSGGPDSLALLAGLLPIAAARGARVLAAHLDHAGDPGSARRAATAARAAAALGVDLEIARRAVLPRRGEPWEAAARRTRYRFLDEVRRARGARWTATAHHRDDQAETVVLRLAGGSGIGGLAAIRPRVGRVVRPLLGLSREELAAAAPPLEAADDPGNRDPALARSRVRHAVLPALEVADPELRARLAALADAALRARRTIDRALDRVLEPRPAAGDEPATVDRAALAALPAPLDRWALARLHRLAGALHPPSEAAAGELARQLAGSSRVRCDGPAGWRWESRGPRLALVRRSDAPQAARFSYKLPVPGVLEVPEAGIVLSVTRSPVAPWMFRAPPWKIALDLPLAAGDHLVIRNRRPGDRVHPLGGPGRRKLKEVLIDRRVPRERRDRLPLVCLPGVDGDGGPIAWVPGVTADDAFRLRDEGASSGGTGRTGGVWVLEVNER